MWISKLTLRETKTKAISSLFVIGRRKPGPGTVFFLLRIPLKLQILITTDFLV